MSRENFIMSTGPIDSQWQAERRADLNYHLSVQETITRLKLSEADQKALTRVLMRDGLVTTGPRAIRSNPNPQL